MVSADFVSAPYYVRTTSTLMKSDKSLKFQIFTVDSNSKIFCAKPPSAVLAVSNPTYQVSLFKRAMKQSF